MASHNKIIIKQLLEFLHLITYFFKYFPFVIIENKKLFYYFLTFKIIVTAKTDNFLKFKKLSVFSTNVFNRYLTNQFNFKMKNLNLNFSPNTPITANIDFVNKYDNVKLGLLNIFFFFNYSYFGTQFNFNSQYKLFYLKNVKNKIIIFDLNKFFLRWNDTYNLLFNFFYYNINPLILSSPLFKNETLALNWQYSHFDINLWRYYFPFFIFKTNKYSPKTDFFFDKLDSLNINTFLITDCHYHFKNLHYIKKKNLYGIGLVDMNSSPWDVFYPILVFFESNLSQAFLFKLLIFLDRQVLFIKYSLFKNYWFKFKLI